jgi:hypothetical protein
VGAQDTLQESFTSDITTYTVTVEATDANGITGATDVQTLGPGVFEAAGGVGFCDGGANYFPFQDSGNTPDSTKPYYARNPCDGSRIWNSTTFGSPDPRTP